MRNILGRVKTGVGVLDRIMEILRVFPRGDITLSPQEISDKIGLPLPTVYRMVQALHAHGLLEKKDSRYTLGLTLLHLGTRVHEGIELRRQALPHLEWLNEQTGENAELHVRQGETRIPIELVRSPHNLRPFVEIGSPLPLHLGAPGKVLLAWLPEDERRSLAAASVARFGVEEAFDPESLQQQLGRIRVQGWIASDGERSPSVAALAVPAFDADGRVAGAVLMSAPSVRLSAKRRREVAPLVKEAADRVSADLGYLVSTPTAGSEA